MSSYQRYAKGTERMIPADPAKRVAEMHELETDFDVDWLSTTTLDWGIRWRALRDAGETPWPIG